MSSSADLIATLREGLNVAQQDYLHLLYEQWVGEDGWPLASVALPLLVGVPPEDWPFHLDDAAREAAAAELESRLAAALGASGDAPVKPLALREWTRREGVALPAAAEQLLDFVARTVPRLAAETAPATPGPDASGATPHGERELVLGAALALVTRFTADCLDGERMFDPRRIARRMLMQSALWFPERPPRMGEDGIVALIEPYIRGF